MLSPSLTDWRAQHERLQRSYARVTGPYSSSVAYDDDLHHFMQDCWHLKDWIRNDPALAIGQAIEDHVRAYKSLRISADLANGSKHLARHKHQEGAYVTSTNVTVHLAQDRPIDVEYIITLDDGTYVSASSLVREAYDDWNTLLTQLKLLP